MQIMDQGVVFKGKASGRTASCCFPSIALLKDESLLINWRAGSHKDAADGTLLVSRSSDAGKTWSEPRQCFDVGKPGELRYGPITALPDGRLIAVVLWVDRSKGLPFFNPETEGLLPTENLFFESSDAGRTWKATGTLSEEPYDGPLIITGPIQVLPDGRLACTFENNKTYEDRRPWLEVAAMRLSSDGGKSWPQHVAVARDPTGQLMYWDMRFAFGPERAIALAWTYDHANQRDRNVHLCESLDNGRTWSPPRHTSLAAQVAQPLFLKDGRLFILYVDRYNARAIKACLSDDLGHTFRDEIIVYQQPQGRVDAGRRASSTEYLQDQELWTFGRIECVADADGDVWLTYYAGDKDATSIYWARLKV